MTQAYGLIIMRARRTQQWLEEFRDGTAAAGAGELTGDVAAARPLVRLAEAGGECWLVFLGCRWVVSSVHHGINLEG